MREGTSRIRSALARSLDILGEPWSLDPESELERLTEQLATRLTGAMRTPDGIVSPLPALLAVVLKRIRVDDAVDRASIRALSLNLLATAMRRRTALRVHRMHAVLLAELSEFDAQLLLALAKRMPSPLLLRLELRCETLRRRAPLPRQVLIVDEREPLDGSDMEWPLTRTRTANLERLALVAWSDRTLTPFEDPEFSRERRHARLGKVPLREGLRRWLAGKHMASAYDDPRLQLTSADSDGVGGIELTFRTLGATDFGRGLLVAVRDGAPLVDRGRQTVDQRPLQQLHTVR